MSVPPPRRPLAASVVRHLAGAVVLVALAAVAFQAVGVLDDVEVVADGTLEDDPADSEEAAGDADGPDVGDDTDASEPPEAAQPGDDETSMADRGEVSEEPDRDLDDDPAAPDDGDDAADGDDDPLAERIDPGSITVQVLDGYQQDQGAAADAVADELAAAGYDLIARNPALRYEETTVLWTAGNEDAARQVAAELGAAEVRAQPGTLSEQVSVHVVVGADRG